jgi:integrase
MPKYESDIRYIIDEDGFGKLFNYASKDSERIWITILWLTGARPAEVLEMKKKDISFMEDGRIQFILANKKLGRDGKFVVNRRKLILRIDMTSRYYKVLKRYLNRIKEDDDDVFQFSRRTGYNIIDRIGWDALGVNICPYNFRHSRLTLLAEKGATETELMRYKGSFTRQSVRPYLHARKVEYDVEVEI